MKQATMKYKAKKLERGHYMYRGFEIRKYPSQGLLPGHKYIWEAIDERGGGFAHSGTLSLTKKLIDDELNK